MRYIKPLNEKKPKGAPEFHHSDAPDAEGRFRDLGIKDLAAWLIKTRKKDVKKISGSLTQQVVFNRNDDPKYAEKMEKVRKEVYKQLGRQDLLDKIDESLEEPLYNSFFFLEFQKWVYKNRAKINRMSKDEKIEYLEDNYIKKYGNKHLGNEDLSGVGSDIYHSLVLDNIIKESILNEEDTWNDYPAAAKKNAQMAIDWKEKYGRDEVDAGTPVGWARAHQLAKGENLSTDTVKRMSAFNRHRKNSSIKPELKETPWKDKGYVAWLIWGGDEGVDWAIEKSKEIDAMKESKQMKFIKSLNEGYWSHYDYDKWTKENGKPKYPKWVKVTLKEIVKGGFMDPVYDAEHNYMVLWLASLETKRRSELYAYDKKGIKELGKVGYAMYQRFYNDLTSYNMFFMQGAMYALEVSKHIRDMEANGEPIEPAYYLMKEYFNNMGMDTKRSRVFNAAYEKLEKWMKDNNIKTL